jgi:hypothetical protein
MTDKQECQGCGRMAIIRHEGFCIKCVDIVSLQKCEADELAILSAVEKKAKRATKGRNNEEKA